MHLKTILDTLNNALAEAFPSVQTVADHLRLTAATPLPSIITEITDTAPAEPRGDDATERFLATITFATFVVYPTDGSERENRIAVRALALLVARRIRYKIPFAGCKIPVVTDIAADYLSTAGDNAAGADNAALVECQRIDWTLDGYVGALPGEPEETVVFDEGIPE